MKIRNFRNLVSTSIYYTQKYQMIREGCVLALFALMDHYINFLLQCKHFQTNVVLVLIVQIKLTNLIYNFSHVFIYNANFKIFPLLNKSIGF